MTKIPPEPRHGDQNAQSEMVALFAALPDGVVVADSDGRITLANSQAELMFGYELHELVGQPVEMLLPQRLREAHPKHREDFMAEPRPRTMGSGLELNGVRKDGSEFPVDISLSAMEGASGPVAIAVIRDIAERKQIEQELAATHEKVRIMLDNVRDSSVISLDAEGRVASWNAGAERIKGYTAKEIIGKHFSILFPEEGAKSGQPERLLQSARENGRTEVEGWRRRKDGTLFWANVVITPLFDDAGNVNAFAKVTRDFTEKREVERALKGSEHLARAILDSLASHIAVLDSEGIIIAVNEAYQRFARENGATDRVIQAVGSNYLEVIDTDHIDSTAAEEAKSGILKVATGALPSFQMEYVCESAVGPQWFLMNVQPMEGDERGLVVAHTNITERRKVEEELRESEKRFREMLENVELIAVTLDAQARVTFCNDYLLRLTDWQREEVIGHDWFSLFIPESHEGEIKLAFDLIHQGEVRPHGENPIKTRSGEIRQILWNNTMLRDSTGLTIGVASIGEDVTERNRALATLERVLEETEWKVQERTADLAEANRDLQEAVTIADAANKAKSNFLSRMSHEFRTPMNAILGFGQLLELTELSKLQADHVHQVLKAGRHLLGLINDILEISRIEAGSIGISLESIPITDVLEESVSLMRPILKERQVNLKIEGSPEGYVVADRQRLRQVVLNLLSNAVKYNVKGGEVVVRAEPKVDGTVLIEIEDTGFGIPQTLQERLFTPFERLGAETKGIEGTGLGLSLSKSLTQAMGGTLTFESVEGVGSCFKIQLAQAKPPEYVDDLGTGPRSADTDVFVQPVTILLIEDNLTNIELLTQVFARRKNFNLMSAMQGRLGLELAREHLPHLILLDLHLPDTTGRDVLLALRAEPELKHIPVIVVSADAFGSQSRSLIEAGALSYITKPFNIAELLAAVDRALSGPLKDEARSGP